MTETQIDRTQPHEFEACLSASCVLHETEHCFCGQGKRAEIHSPLGHPPPIMEEPLASQVRERRRSMEAHLAQLQEIISRDLYRTPPMELRALTWRERFAALNRFRWTEFRSGVGRRFVDDPSMRSLSGLAAWIP